MWWSNVDVWKIFQENDFRQILDQQNLQECLKSSQKLDRMCSYLSGKPVLLQKGIPQEAIQNVCVKFLNHLGPPYIDEYSFSKHSIIKLQLNGKIWTSSPLTPRFFHNPKYPLKRICQKTEGQLLPGVSTTYCVSMPLYVTCKWILGIDANRGVSGLRRGDETSPPQANKKAY